MTRDALVPSEAIKNPPNVDYLFGTTIKKRGSARVTLAPLLTAKGHISNIMKWREIYLPYDKLCVLQELKTVRC